MFDLEWFQLALEKLKKDKTEEAKTFKPTNLTSRYRATGYLECLDEINKIIELIQLSESRKE